MGADETFARLGAYWGGTPGPHRPRRPADDVWDALCAVLGWDPHPNDKTTRTRLGRVVKELVAMDATPADVRARASRYRVVMGDRVMLTPEALLKHWAACAPPQRPVQRIDEVMEEIGDLDARMTLREALDLMNGAMDMRAAEMNPNAGGTT